MQGKWQLYPEEVAVDFVSHPVTAGLKRDTRALRAAGGDQVGGACVSGLSVARQVRRSKKNKGPPLARVCCGVGGERHAIFLGARRWDWRDGAGAVLCQSRLRILTSFGYRADIGRAPHLCLLPPTRHHLEIFLKQFIHCDSNHHLALITYRGRLQ